MRLALTVVEKFINQIAPADVRLNWKDVSLPPHPPSLQEKSSAGPDRFSASTDPPGMQTVLRTGTEEDDEMVEIEQ